MKAKATNGLRVIHPGIVSLVQDLGRFGYQHLGLTTGGAADEHAFLWANRLLHNPPNCAALEISFGGLQLESEVATRIAITGADAPATLNGHTTPLWQTVNLKPGDHLHLGYFKSGVRAYLAVQGGFGIQPTLGSVATVIREQIGGIDGRGRALRKGDCLPCLTASAGPCVRVPPEFIPDYNQPLVLRVIETHPHTPFSKGDLKRFYASEYEIANQSDRMGVRVSGKPLNPNINGIISEGTSFGTIQVPPDGQPIILLKDRQTIGGYPKLGTVFTLDAFALSQRQAHTKLLFEPMPLKEAQQNLKQFYRFFGV